MATVVHAGPFQLPGNGYASFGQKEEDEVLAETGVHASIRKRHGWPSRMLVLSGPATGIDAARALANKLILKSQHNASLKGKGNASLKGKGKGKWQQEPWRWIWQPARWSASAVSLWQSGPWASAPVAVQLVQPQAWAQQPSASWATPWQGQSWWTDAVLTAQQEARDMVARHNYNVAMASVARNRNPTSTSSTSSSSSTPSSGQASPSPRATEVRVKEETEGQQTKEEKDESTQRKDHNKMKKEKEAATASSSTDEAPQVEQPRAKQQPKDEHGSDSDGVPPHMAKPVR